MQLNNKTKELYRKINEKAQQFLDPWVQRATDYNPIVITMNEILDKIWKMLVNIKTKAPIKKITYVLIKIMNQI